MHWLWYDEKYDYVNILPLDHFVSICSFHNCFVYYTLTHSCKRVHTHNVHTCNTYVCFDFVKEKAFKWKFLILIICRYMQNKNIYKYIEWRRDKESRRVREEREKPKGKWLNFARTCTIPIREGRSYKYINTIYI